MGEKVQVITVAEPAQAARRAGLPSESLAADEHLRHLGAVAVQAHGSAWRRSGRAAVRRSVCRSTSPGLAIIEEHLNDSMLSTRVMQLGVHSVCSKHGEAWDAYEATYQQGMGTTEPASEPAPVKLAFDTEHTFADGVTISVSEPVPYTRTEDDLYAALAEGGPDDGARVTVTVTNGSQGEGTPSSLFGSATLDRQPLAFASAPQGELVRAGSTLLPGRTRTFDELY